MAISNRGVMRILMATMLVFVASVAVAQETTSPRSTPNQLKQRPAASRRVEKRTTECLNRALQDMYAKGWRGGSLIVAVMDLCPYPGLPVTVDDYAQLVHTQVSQFNKSISP